MLVERSLNAYVRAISAQPVPRNAHASTTSKLSATDSDHAMPTMRGARSTQGVGHYRGSVGG